MGLYRISYLLLILLCSGICPRGSHATRYLTLGFISTSRYAKDPKWGPERRVMLHPKHFEQIPPERRAFVLFEEGYGERFGLSDQQIRGMGFEVVSKDDLWKAADVLLTPKVHIEDYRQVTNPGQALFGLQYLTYKKDALRAAIERRATAISLDAMKSTGPGYETTILWEHRGINGEAAVYDALAHTRKKIPSFTPKRALVLGFGNVSRAAVEQLRKVGVGDIMVATKRPTEGVGGKIPSVRYVTMRGGVGGEPVVLLDGEKEVPLLDLLDGVDVLVNGEFQPAKNPHPLMFVQSSDLDEHKQRLAGYAADLKAYRDGRRPSRPAKPRFRKPLLIIDIIAHRGTAFPFARNLPLLNPLRNATTLAGGDGAPVHWLYYAGFNMANANQDFANRASEAISGAIFEVIEALQLGNWLDNPQLQKAIRVYRGTVPEEQKALLGAFPELMSDPQLAEIYRQNEMAR